MKAYTPASYDYPKTDGLAKGNKLQDVMQERKIDILPIY